MLPSPIKQISTTKIETMIKAFIGTRLRLLTVEIHLENGSPSSKKKG